MGALTGATVGALATLSADSRIVETEHGNSLGKVASGHVDWDVTAAVVAGLGPASRRKP